MSHKPSARLRSRNDIFQLIRIEKNFLTAISPLVGTYSGRARGRLRLSIYVLPKSIDADRALSFVRFARSKKNRFGRLWRSLVAAPLVEMTTDCRELRDNESVDLFMGDGRAEGELVAVHVEGLDTRPGAAPSVWLASDGERIPGHLACFSGPKELEDFGLRATTLYAPPFAVSAVPPSILYSPITQCNLNCIHCISRDTRKEVARISSTVKNEIRRWSAEGRLDSLASDYSGDLLWADKRNPGELQFVIDLGIPFHIDTNGACLTEDVAERLCRSTLTSINVSLDAATEATYRRVRRGAPPLDEIHDNIRVMVAARERHGCGFSISTSFTAMRSTLAELGPFIGQAARLNVDAVYVRHLEVYTPDMEEESLWWDRDGYNIARREALAMAAALGVSLNLPPPFGKAVQKGHAPCQEPWRSAVILGNGDVQACCVPGLKMGNLNDRSMEDIWNGPRYAELRRTVNSATPPAPCKTCPIFRKTDNPDSYLLTRE